MKVFINASISVDTAVALENFSKRTGLTKAKIISNAITEYIEKNKV